MCRVEAFLFASSPFIPGKLKSIMIRLRCTLEATTSVILSTINIFLAVFRMPGVEAQGCQAVEKLPSCYFLSLGDYP
jgi:hypothetical protein